MNFLVSALTAGIILGCQISYAGTFSCLSGNSLSDSTPVLSKDNFENFNLCYQAQRVNGNVEKGFIGIFEGKKYFFECWTVPGQRGITFNYIILRSDTATIIDYDFCFQKPAEDPDLHSNMIVCKVKNVDGNFVVDLSMRFEKIPTIIQPLVIGLRGNQHLLGFNRSLKLLPQIYFSAGSLRLRYFVYNRNINLDESTIIVREYRYDGSEFKFYSESFVKNKKIRKAILYGEL